MFLTNEGQRVPHRAASVNFDAACGRCGHTRRYHSDIEHHQQAATGYCVYGELGEGCCGCPGFQHKAQTPEGQR